MKVSVISKSIYPLQKVRNTTIAHPLNIIDSMISVAKNISSLGDPTRRITDAENLCTGSDKQRIRQTVTL